MATNNTAPLAADIRRALHAAREATSRVEAILAADPHAADQTFRSAVDAEHAARERLIELVADADPTDENTPSAIIVDGILIVLNGRDDGLNVIDLERVVRVA
jgi:hypothetical protein